MASKAAYLEAISEEIPDPDSRLRLDLEAVVNETAPWETITKLLLVSLPISGGQRIITGEFYDPNEAQAITQRALLEGLIEY